MYDWAVPSTLFAYFEEKIFNAWFDGVNEVNRSHDLQNSPDNRCLICAGDFASINKVEPAAPAELAGRAISLRPVYDEC